MQSLYFLSNFLNFLFTCIYGNCNMHYVTCTSYSNSLATIANVVISPALSFRISWRWLYKVWHILMGCAFRVYCVTSIIHEMLRNIREVNTTLQKDKATQHNSPWYWHSQTPFLTSGLSCSPVICATLITPLDPPKIVMPIFHQLFVKPLWTTIWPQLMLCSRISHQAEIAADDS